MMAKPKSASRLDSGPQLRVLRQHQSGPVAALQPQTVPDHEGAKLGGGDLSRDQPEDRFAGRTLDLLVGDHAEDVHPSRDAVADRHHIMPEVVVPKQLVLHGLNRGEHGRGIGGRRAPFFSDQAEHILRLTSTRQNG